MLYHVHISLIYNSQKLEETHIYKMWDIYTMEYCSAIRNSDFIKFLSKWMLVEAISLSKVTQSQKHKICTH